MIPSRVTQFLSLWVRPSVLFSALLVVSLAFGYILYNSVYTFDAEDPKPVIYPISEKMETAIPLEVGLGVTHIPEFNMADSAFVFDMLMWFEFDESLIPLEQVQKFSFQRGTIEKMSEPFISREGNKTLALYRIRLAFSSFFEHKRFPLNDHTIYLALANHYMDASKVRFVASSESFILEPGLETGGWRTVGQATEVGYYKDLLRKEPLTVLENPGVIFSIDLVKTGMREVILIIFPMFILFVVSLLTFLLDPTNGAILFLSTGSLTGLTAYRFVIQNIMPRVGYFTFTDHTFNLFLGAIFIILLVNIFVVNKGVDTQEIKALKGATVIAVLLTILGSLFLLAQ